MKIDRRKLIANMARSCMNTKDISENAKVSKATIYRILHIDNNVRFSTAGKLARALNVDVLDLLAEPEAKQA